MIPSTTAPIVSIEVGGSGTQTVRFDGSEPRFADGIAVGGDDRVGIAIPGRIDRSTNRVIVASTLGWVDVDPVDALGLPFTPDVVCNDAGAAALGEWALRGGRDDRIVFIGLGTGIGGAIVDRGSIERENLFGHQRPFGERDCACGQVGCLETVAAGWALPDPLDDSTLRRVAADVARAVRAEVAAGTGVIVIGGGIPQRYPGLVHDVGRELSGRTVVPSSAPVNAKSAAAWGVRHLLARHTFGVEVRMHADPAACASDAATVIERAIDHTTTPAISVATGSTPLATYAELGRRGRDLGSARFYLLDEYVGLAPDDEHRYLTTIRRDLGELLGVDADHVRAPDVDRADVDVAAAGYESELVSRGGIDVAILGIGRNGHIAFNEPGTPFGSLTRVVELSDSTRQANARFFAGRRDDVPTRAITQGIATIMRARTVLLIATGRSKAAAVQAMLREIDPAVPASALRRHPNAVVVADRAAVAGTDLS